MKKIIVGIFIVLFSVSSVFAEYIVLDWNENPNSLAGILYNTILRYVSQTDDPLGIVVVEVGSVSLIDRSQESSIIFQSTVFKAGARSPGIILSDGTKIPKGAILPRDIMAFQTIFDVEPGVFAWSNSSGSLAEMLFEAFTKDLLEEEFPQDGDYTWISHGEKKGHAIGIQRQKIPVDDLEMDHYRFKLHLNIRRGIQEVVRMLNERAEELKTGGWDCLKIPTELERQTVSRMFSQAYTDALKRRGLMVISVSELKTLFGEIGESQGWSQSLIREMLSDDFFQEFREFLGGARYDVSKLANLIARRFREVILFRKG